MDGARTFFAPEAHIELRPEGPYEMYFDSDAPVGERGGEGCTVLEAARGRLPHLGLAVLEVIEVQVVGILTDGVVAAAQ